MKLARSGPKTWELSAAVRDAVGLSSDQKAFLWNITSHHKHKEFGTRELIMQRTGLTDFRLRKALKVLKENGVVRVEERPGSTTVYTIHHSTLKSLTTTGNPVAVANAATRRSGPKRTVSVATAPVRRSAELNHVGHQQARPVGHQQRKSEREASTEDQENKSIGSVADVKRRARASWDALTERYEL
jgi:hypothetical protein